MAAAPAARAAQIAHFQQAHGLKVTGHIDHATQLKLKLHQQNAAAKNNPAAVTAPLTPGVLNREVGAAVQSAFGPQEQAVQQQITQSGQNQQHVTDWFQQYRHAIGAATAASQAAYTAAQNQLSGFGAQSQQADNQANQQLASSMQQDAANRGATVSPQVAGLGTQASASRAQAVGNQLQQVGSLGANQAGFLAGVNANAVGSEGLAHQQEQQRGQALQGQLGTLRGQAGAFGAQTRMQLTQAERNYQAALQGLGIKAQSVNTATSLAQSLEGHRNAQDKNALARLKVTRQNNAANNATTQRGQNLNHQDRAARNAILAGKKPKSPKESQSSFKLKGAIHDAMALIRDGQGHKLSSTQIRANLFDGANPRKQKFDQDIINAAYDLVVLKYLSRPNIVALKRRGVSVPKQWTVKPPVPKSTPATSAGGLVGGAAAPGGQP